MVLAGGWINLVNMVNEAVIIIDNIAVLRTNTYSLAMRHLSLSLRTGENWGVFEVI